MAEKKTATKKSATKKKTTKKEIKKANKTVKLTFRPLFSAAQNHTVSLTSRNVEIDNGMEVVKTKPAIEGLPRLFTIKAGEIVEVSQEQFEKLKEFGCIETADQVKYRKELEKNVDPQHPRRITYDMHDSQRDNTLNASTMKKIYNDKFIVVE